MIYTGYFARMKYYKGPCYSIARYTPKGINCGHCAYFYPTKELLDDWKQGKITQEQYIERYKSETLDKININHLKCALSKHYEDIYLLCYEKPMDFCHRHIVAKWLREELDIPCVESKD